MKCYAMHLFVGALMWSSAVALAQPRLAPQGGPPAKNPRMQGIEALNLTAEQKQKIHTVLAEARKKAIELEAKIRIARIELRELMAADTPDRGKIDAKVAEIGKLQETRMRQHVDSALQVQQVLTPEQRQKAKELRLFRHEGRRFRGEFRHRGSRFPGRMGADEDRPPPPPFGDDAEQGGAGVDAYDL